jgi:hypothetical protein
MGILTGYQPMAESPGLGFCLAASVAAENLNEVKILEGNKWHIHLDNRL